MSNAFTKKYLTELIDGRLEAIKQPEDRGRTGDEKLLVQMREDNTLAAAAHVTRRGKEHIARIEMLLEQLGDTTIPRAQTIAELNREIGAMQDLRWSHSVIYDSSQIAAVEQRIGKARQAAGGSNPGGEASRLERVKKYIEDSPAEEFSLTLMRSLGFLDIIKFAINN